MDPKHTDHLEEGDDEAEMPLHSKRAFGAGLHRRPIAFVPAKAGGLATTREPAAPARSIADFYLEMVLPKDGNSGSSTPDAAPVLVCEVCQLPMEEEDPTESQPGKPSVRRHEASLAHQVCITHSHPPSALDRSRMGLSVLQSQGWDPDSRKGLGAVEQGIQYPIKAKEKRDNLGIGVKVPKNLETYKKEKPQKLDAGKVRKMAAEDKKRRDRLQRQFYGNGELEKYLGSG
ncbi:hypothetical protein PFICI_04496 [Pestalotiopsis fici W106-1]|uniref:G-patch domain-containing protein n=1 Tax=Pestalotiopsis fici (strain W106-1 / CGMCC3.15140) TaxID=1229662 RepID=W3X990_PESFW|nr:uncharacterized protein PFICI_04496 [Pestalotiopsis fici W106-1]ETS82620.1 hypothetical protein PFICI_04496 [Pestalotiopsis fici W106-1]